MRPRPCFQGVQPAYFPGPPRDSPAVLPVLPITLPPRRGPPVLPITLPPRHGPPVLPIALPPRHGPPVLPIALPHRHGPPVLPITLPPRHGPPTSLPFRHTSPAGSTPSPVLPASVSACHVVPVALGPRHAPHVEPVTLPPLGPPVRRPPQPITKPAVYGSRNCSPSYMQLTMGAVPMTGALALSSRLPMALCVHPLAQHSSSAEALPLLDCGLSSIIRCAKCRAFLNPFVSVDNWGYSWTCNFCNTANEAPLRDGNRHDVDVLDRDRLELRHVRDLNCVQSLLVPCCVVFC